MRVLVPIDESDCSFRALEFAIGFVDRYDADIHVVHLTDTETAITEDIVERAEEKLDGAGLPGEVEVVTEVRKFRASKRVGKDIIEIAEDIDADHVVMGHHGEGLVGRAILGSAAETVIRSAEIPTTIIP